jgi:hypothetical protein
MTSIHRFFILAIFLSPTASLLAQENLSQIKTTDGNTIRAEIIESTADSTTIYTRSLRKITLANSSIKSIKAPKTYNIDTVWRQHPTQTNHFVTGNAYNLEKGESYYQNSWFFFNHAAVGITDHFSIGAGFFPGKPLGAGASPFWLTPKISVPIIKDKLNIAIGSFVSYSTIEMIAALPYSNITVGKKDKNVTFGVGMGYDDYWEKRPLISVSTLIRTSNKGYFISENHYIAGDAVISIGGRRIIGRTSIDYGLTFPAWESDIFIGIPWIGMRTPLSSKRPN